MTPVFCCGGECGIEGPHWDATSDGTFSTATVRSGARSLRCNPTAGSQNFVSIAFSSFNTYVARFYVRFETLPNANAYIFTANQGGSTSFPGVAFRQSDSKLYPARVAGGTFSFGAQGFTVTTGQWYRVDVKVVTTNNPWTIDVQVDGTALTQYAPAVAGSTNMTSFLLAALPTQTSDIFWDDIIVSQTAADYPIGAGKVDPFTTTADGTHNIAGANDYERTGTGTDIDNTTTTAYQLIDKVPLEATPSDYINMIAPTANSYTEHIFGPAPGISTPTVAPRAVEVITAFHQSGTGTGNMAIRLNDNGTTDDVVLRSGVAGSTSLIFARKHYAAGPAGAWVIGGGGNGDFTDLRVRFDATGTADANPDQFLDAVMIEAEFLEGDQAYEEFPSDTITLSDTPTKTATFIRSMSDTTTMSDTAKKTPTLPRSDSITLSDAKIIAAVLNKADTISLSDQAALTAVFIRSFSDTISLSDQAALSMIINKADTITLSDAAVKRPTLNRTDTITLTDAVVRTLGLNKADTVTLTDAIAKAFTINKSDTITLSDFFDFIKYTLLELSDTINLSDTTVKNIVLNKADVITLTDAIAKSLSLTKADTITLTDLVVKSPVLNKSDTITLSDLFDLIKYTLVELSDTITLSDANVKSVGVAKSDTITLSDLASKLVEFNRAFSETITLTDAITKATGLNKADSITLTDTIVKQVIIAKADGITLSDAIANSIDRNLSDTITLSDAEVKAITKILADIITLTEDITVDLGGGGATDYELDIDDTISLTDLIFKTYTKYNSDSITFSDALLKATGKNLTDTITTVDNEGKVVTKLINDTITGNDLINTVKAYIRSLTDSITLADEITISSSGFINLNLSDTITLSDAMIMFERVKVFIDSSILTALAIKSQITYQYNIESEIHTELNIESHVSF